MSPPTERERARKNREVFDATGRLSWRRTVYEPLHDGWRFINIGGRRALDYVASTAALTRSSEALELCCGFGDTCYYLALRSGCQMTGIDRNERQLSQSLGRIGEEQAEVAERVRLVAADVSTYTLRRRFDAIYELDSLMYLPDRRLALANARKMLREGGSLVLAEVMAGGPMSDALRRFLWESDGVIEMPEPDQQAAMLAETGFRRVTMYDWTELARTTLERIVCATVRHKKELVAAGERYDEWLEGNQQYRELFESGSLVYTVTSATA